MDGILKSIRVKHLILLWIADLDTRRSARSVIISAFFITGISFVLASITEGLYVDVDNFYISVVTNGLFGSEDNYCLYLHPFLCWGIGVLARIFLKADCFALLGHILIWIEVMWFGCLIFGSEMKKHMQIVSAFLLIFISWGLNIWNINYTVQASSFVLTGMFTLYLTMRRERRMFKVVGTFFVCLGMMWRMQAAMIFLPFAVLVFGIDVLFGEMDKVQYLRSWCKVFGPTIVALFVLMLSVYLTNTSQKYLPSIEYNAARTIVNDYPTKTWDEVEKEISNISEREYNAARRWYLFDTENITVDSLAEMAEVGKKTEFPISAKGFMLTLSSMAFFVLRSNRMLLMLLGVIMLLLGRILLAPYPWCRKAEGLLACMGAGIIIFYFTIKGRAPLRIWQSVLFATMGVLLIVICSANTDINECKRVLRIDAILCVMLCLALGYKMITAEYQMPQFAIIGRGQVDDSLYKETYEEDAVYVWDQWHANTTRYFMEKGKLPSNAFLEHNITLGDWEYGQVYYSAYLKRLGVENPARCLVEREKTYLVSMDCMEVLEYLQEHFDENIVVEKIGVINNVPIWHFRNFVELKNNN